MVTMKDVAKLAGVSHGTVSNVINGVKNVSVDKIKKVEAAMAQLGYTPNTAARNLKMEFTNQIDLVVPNMLTGEFIQLYEAVRKCTREKNYTLNLKVTDGIPDEECRILNESRMNNVDGVILVTCQPSNVEFFEDIRKRGLNIVFTIVDMRGSNCNFVGVNVDDIMKRIIDFLRTRKLKVAMMTGNAESTFHDHLINAYCKGILQDSAADRYMEIIQISPQFSAKGAAKLFQLADRPDVVIVSNETIAREIHKFQHLLEGPDADPIKVVIFNQGKSTPFFNDYLVPLPIKTIGRTAFDALLDIITGKAGAGNFRTLVSPEFALFQSSSVKPLDEPKKIRVLLNESPSSAAVKAMLPNFTRRTGIEVEIVTRKMSDMYDHVKADHDKKEFDIYSVDFPWMEELSRIGYIENLDKVGDVKKLIDSEYRSEMNQSFAHIKGAYYGVPYVFSTQILFYRKDLFDKIKNQRLYYEWYKEELKVPETWEDFNKVARLFTREFNPDSETLYGITAGGEPYSGAVLEYLPRLWSYGGSLFEDNRFLDDPEIAVKALDSYIEGFRYANPNAVNWWWNEQVQEFVEGNAAMMVMYVEHATNLVEQKSCCIEGKYETALLPGKTSVLGGWYLAARKGAKHTAEINEFFKWILDLSLLEENAILGRLAPVNNQEAREVVSDIYSWYDTALEACNYTKAREYPNMLKSSFTEPDLERMVGKWVHEAVVGNMDSEEALKNLKKELIHRTLNSTM